METFTIKRLSTPTVFKLLLTDLLCGGMPLALLLAVFASLGAEVFQFNGAFVTGPVALIGLPLFVFILILLGSLFLGTVISLGLWLYARFKPFHLHYAKH
ncbi:MAG: hypothetical protein KA214_07385 [Neisseriaceae bacterium]|nr:hypothetical protein [Neisseriaceae bacterium]